MITRIYTATSLMTADKHAMGPCSPGPIILSKPTWFWQWHEYLLSCNRCLICPLIGFVHSFYDLKYFHEIIIDIIKITYIQFYNKGGKLEYNRKFI